MLAADAAVQSMMHATPVARTGDEDDVQVLIPTIIGRNNTQTASRTAVGRRWTQSSMLEKPSGSLRSTARKPTQSNTKTPPDQTVSAVLTVPTGALAETTA